MTLPARTHFATTEAEFLVRVKDVLQVEEAVATRLQEEPRFSDRISGQSMDMVL